MDNKEQTMTLSDDPKFIEHVSKTVAEIRKWLASHTHRTPYLRLEELGLLDPPVLSAEYERVLRSMSTLPAILRETIRYVGNLSSLRMARELAEDSKNNTKQ